MGEKVKTMDLSGMGGGYENCCQQMIWNGIRAIEADPHLAQRALKQMKSIPNVFGVVSAEGADARELDRLVMKDVKDATGAMHHQVMLNLAFIAQNGKEKWLATIEEEQPERIFEWDGTAKSCPKTDLSERMRNEKSDGINA